MLTPVKLMCRKCLEKIFPAKQSQPLATSGRQAQYVDTVPTLESLPPHYEATMSPKESPSPLKNVAPGASYVPRPQGLPAGNHYSLVNFNDLIREYEYLWSLCEIRPTLRHWTTLAASTAILSKHRYKTIEESTGVPWFFVACIHMRESFFNFRNHLHNGDSLAFRTHNVPSGRPVKGKPPFTFEESTIDALDYMGFSGLRDWSMTNIFYRLEKYNGHGYRYRNIPSTTPKFASPYLYSGTQFYEKGKYRSDGIFEADTVDSQVGAMAFFKALTEQGEKIF